MFESLGLGIRLDLTDNVSPRADKILLKFDALQRSAGNLVQTINGIDQAIVRFEGLTIAGFAIMRIANEFNQFGKAVTGMFVDLGNQVVETGAKFEQYGIMLKTFYGDALTAKKAMVEGIKIAAQTPFEVEDVIRSMSSMKAIGVDVLQKFKAPNGENREFLKYLSDLAAIAPPEQGMRGMMIGIRNLFGGNERSFMMRMDIKPSQILGRALSKDQAGLMKDIVELSQKLTPNLTDALMGTWTQLISNMKDYWTLFKYYVSESGAFDKAKETLASMYEMLRSVDMQKIANNLRTTFEALWVPVDALGKAIMIVIKGFISLSETSPVLTKILVSLIGATGVLSLIAGKFLAIFGSIIMAVSGLGTFLVMYASAVNKTQNFAKTIEGVVTGINKFMRVMTFGALGIAAFSYAYYKNLFGIRDMTEEIIGRIKDRWKSVGDLITDVMMERKPPNVLTQLQGIDKFIAKIMTLGVILRGVFYQGFGDKVVFTVEQMRIIDAMGMRPLAVTLVMLKGRFKEFWAGVKEGATFAKEVFLALYNTVAAVVKPIIKMIDYLISRMTGKATDGIFGVMPGKTDDIAKWKEIGKVAGGLLGALVSFKIVGVVISGILAPFKVLSSMMTNINKLADGVSNSFKKIKSPFYKDPMPTRLDYAMREASKKSPYWQAIMASQGITEDYAPRKMGYSKFNPFKRARQEWSVYHGLKNVETMLDEGNLATFGGKPVRVGDAALSEKLHKELRARYEPKDYREIMRSELYKDKRTMLGEYLFGKRYSRYERVSIGKDQFGKDIMSPRKVIMGYQGGLLNRRSGQLIDLSRGEMIRDRLAEIADAMVTRATGMSIGEFSSITGDYIKNDKQIQGIKRGAQKVGRFTGKIGGGIGKGVRGAGQLLGAGIRGAGMVASVGLRALPFIGMGIMGGQALYSAISNYGGEAGFTGGVQKMKDKISSGEYKPMFQGLIKSAKEAWKVVKELAVVAWKEISKELPPLIGRAWLGIKKSFSIAMLAIIKWVITSFVPGLLKALLAIGKFIIFELAPSMVKGLMEIGVGLVDWIAPSLTSSLKSFFNFLIEKWNYFMGIMNRDASKIALFDTGERNTAKYYDVPSPATLGMQREQSIVTGMHRPGQQGSQFDFLGKHHKGLWMNPNEQVSVIRKDETVLPPNISRKLNNMIDGNNSVNVANANIIVQADKLSRADAREQAKMIYEEFQKIGRENKARGGTFAFG